MAVLNHALSRLTLLLIQLYDSFYNKGYAHVAIDKGILRGRVTGTWNGTRYYSFKGIPFAEPPVGHLRFKGPREERPWDGVRDALEHGSVCPQLDPFYHNFRGSEDCLFLNVYTPALGDKRLPVMVFVYGGEYKFASGNDDYWGPDYFVENGVVLVTFNHRLGALGFLTTEDDEAPGNAGLKDQVAVLRWVRRNIANFGGDPDGVTIFGSSSGATCVHYLVLSPMASGLFRGAIAQSGSAFHGWALARNGSSIAIRLAVAMGAKGVNGDKARALGFLKRASPEDMVLAHETLATPAERQSVTKALFVPSIERNVESEEVLIGDWPLNILRSGNFNDVPLILGYTSHEANIISTVLENPETWQTATKCTKNLVPKHFRTERSRQRVAESIRKFYFSDKPIGRKNITNLVNLYSDVLFTNDVKRARKFQLQAGRSPIHFYVFAYAGDLNLVKFGFGVTSPGAIHGDELGYLFYHKQAFWRKPARGSGEEYVLKTMLRLWTNFAKYGNPTPPGDPLTWKPTTLDRFNFLNISGWDTRLDVNPDPERTDFWTNAYASYDGHR